MLSFLLSANYIEVNSSTMTITMMRIAVLVTCPDKGATSCYQYGIAASLSQRAFTRY